MNVSEQFVLSNNKENIDFTLQSTEQYFNGNVTGIVFENNIEDGDYQVSFVKNGYQSININVSLANGIKLLADESMVSIIGNINNTVSGIIRDNLGNNTLVALYKIENNKEILVATTYTNSIGKYMFGNVIDGNYLVKSKLGR